MAERASVNIYLDESDLYVLALETQRKKGRRKRPTLTPEEKK